MRLKPTNHMKPWTLAEVSTLKRLIEEDAPPRVIATMLSRTLEAVDHMMWVEKLSRKVRSAS